MRCCWGDQEWTTGRSWSAHLHSARRSVTAQQVLSAGRTATWEPYSRCRGLPSEQSLPNQGLLGCSRPGTAPCPCPREWCRPPIAAQERLTCSLSLDSSEAAACHACKRTASACWTQCLSTATSDKMGHLNFVNFGGKFRTTFRKFRR